MNSGGLPGLRIELEARDPCLRGSVRVPSDKSITQRAVLLGGTARGETRVRRPLDSADARSVLGVVRALGAEAECGDELWTLRGTGLAGLRRSPGALDFGNSGTGARLGLGLISGLQIEAEVVGDASLSQRPMRRVLDPLGEMGAGFDGGPTLPLWTRPAGPLRPFIGRLKVASAQVKSAILLAGLRADGRTRVEEPVATRDHTERMLPAFGVPVRREGDFIELEGPVEWSGAEIEVPADPSSVAPLAAAVALCPGSVVAFDDVLRSPRRGAFFEVLEAMGARVRWSGIRTVGREEVGRLEVEAGALRGVEVPVERVPDMIDEFPLVAVLGALAEGTTRVRGARELRVKESDRIATMREGLEALGAAFEEQDDGFVVEGRERLRGASVRSHADHRIAMALGVAALRCEGPLILDDAGAVAVSFPAFFDELERLAGGGLRREDRG